MGAASHARRSGVACDVAHGSENRPIAALRMTGVGGAPGAAPEEGAQIVSRKLIVIATALAVLLAGSSVAAARPASPHASPHITLVSAKAGAGGVIVVKVRIRGWKMYPALVGKAPKAGGGHWHIIVDGKYNNFSANAATGVSKKVAAGKHKVYAILAQDNHAQLSGAGEKTRTVTVRVM
jgi:hypothetical protein